MILIRSKGEKDTNFYIINILKFNYITASEINVQSLYYSFFYKNYAPSLSNSSLPWLHLIMLATKPAKEQNILNQVCGGGFSQKQNFFGGGF